MAVIGIGGAGGKLADLMGTGNSAVNVSAVELEKLNLKHKIQAYVNTERGSLHGCKKDPKIGQSAFNSVRMEILDLIRGNAVICSSGGGTGNGITSQILDYLSGCDLVLEQNKSNFMVVLPHPEKEAAEYVNNTIGFLKNSLSAAMDRGNTGNVFLYSNKAKFENRISEADFNQMIADNYEQYRSIPEKGDRYELIEGHIDREDFRNYSSKSFYNYFTSFNYDPHRYFGDQLNENYNNLLLWPAEPIEALFLLEVPENGDSTVFYNILDHFSNQSITPIHGVIRNPELSEYRVTVSMLYSRKPMELISDYQRVSEEIDRTKIQRMLNQQVKFDNVAVDLREKADQVAQESGQQTEEILNILKRIGKR